MAMDEAHEQTTKTLQELEADITKVYGDAAKEMQAKVDSYWASFAEREAKQKDLIGTEVNGKVYTKDDFAQWRLTQEGRGKQMEDLTDKLANRMVDAKSTAYAYINDTTPGVYSLNRNYAAYSIEQVSGNVGFTMWDENTVKRLITEQPNLISNYSLAEIGIRGDNVEKIKKEITKSVTSGILQGESIDKIAKRMTESIPNVSKNRAVAAARTAVTSAQNAGRLDSYEAAKNMGIKVKKQWLATLDSRTRDEHGILDGQTVETDDYFEVNGYRLQYPGDPDGAPEMVVNCRCTMISVIEGVDTSDAERRARNEESGENDVISTMTFNEWTEWKANGH